MEVQPAAPALMSAESVMISACAEDAMRYSTLDVAAILPVELNVAVPKAVLELAVHIPEPTSGASPLRTSPAFRLVVLFAKVSLIRTV